MQRKCSKCGFNVDENVQYCPKCGSNEFVNIVEAQPQYNSFPSSVTTKGKKGLKWWQILLIVIASILVGLIIVGIFAPKDDEENKSNQNTFTIGQNDSAEKTKYSKGKIENGYYVNEWADFKFKISDTFPETPDAYSRYENSTTDCGFVSLNELSGKQVVFCFEDLSSYWRDYSSKDYMDACKKNLDSTLSEQQVEYNLSEYETKTIADKDFTVMKLSIPSNGVTDYICVCVIDKHAMCMHVSSNSNSEIELAFNSMSSIN